MKYESKIDVPVLLMVFIRPNKLQQVFDVIREARPSVLFLISDGPRENVPTDKENIMASRKVVENVDWDCTVHRLYSDKNIGMYATFKKALDFTFSIVDRCIFLEDDIVTSVSFFRFCAELLEKYKDDLRVNMICGMNHLGEYKDTSSDYFFTRGSSIWGHAYWRRTYKQFYDFSYGDDSYTLSRADENSKYIKSFNKSLNGYLGNKNFSGHPAGPEFFLELNCILNSTLNIVASKNMVRCIGYGKDGTHSGELKKMPRVVQKLFNMETYEYEFPLKHPKYVVNDAQYLKKLFRIMAVGHPLVRTCRRIESICRDDFSIFKRVFQKIIRNKIVEK